MFATSTDSSLTFPIRYVGDAGDAVPVRRRGSRRWRRVVASLGVAAAIVAGGAFVAGQAARPSAGGPVPGEFRLAPGNQMPPGVVVPLPRSAVAPVPGEYRLAPGNQMPLGVVVPLPRSAGGPVPGEYRLAPGNQMPPGVVVPLR